jgi:hypothetical protein
VLCSPLIALGDGATEEPELIVSLSPKLMDPVTMGLYLEDGELKYDFLEDWDRFWSPIKQRLWRSTDTAIPQPLTWPLSTKAYLHSYLNVTVASNSCPA